MRARSAQIRALRLEKAWTQRELAIKAGIYESHLGRIERGKTSGGFKSLRGIAHALGVDFKEIVEFDVGEEAVS